MGGARNTFKYGVKLWRGLSGTVPCERALSQSFIRSVHSRGGLYETPPSS